MASHFFNESLIGKKFNKLTLIKTVGQNKNGYYMGLFKCECGNSKIINISNVKRGKVKSCGCAYKYNKKANIYVLCGSYYNVYTEDKKICFQIDKKDKAKIDSHYFSICKNGYIASSSRKYLHNYLFDYDHKKYVIDHINNNKLDNRRNNLRLASYKLNSLNRKATPKYISVVKRNNNRFYIVQAFGKYKGCYKDLEKAQQAANKLLAIRKEEISGAAL